MRKIITILLILQSILIFGQPSITSFDNECIFLKVNENIVLCASRNWDINEYLKTIYSFRANNSLFILSYEHQDDYANNQKVAYGGEKTRNVYLYKLDDYSLTWSIASDVIKTDYFRRENSENVEYSMVYLEIESNLGTGSGSITVLDNGNVEIVLMYFEKKMKAYWNDYDTKWMKITLIPTKDKFYKVKR